ncbi:GroES-like protein [Dentipellis sp. KUC8613]|nr:GroES-like protein [Dentipellis sp. KUC8613]
MAPSTQKAVVVQADGSVVITSVPVPKPGPGQILVKVAAVAQNPVDFKTIAWVKKEGAIVGCDYAGTVEEIGPDVPAGLRTIGERVAGFVFGSYYKNGSCAQYVLAEAAPTVHLPENWSFEDGSQLGVGPFTAAQLLWEAQQLPTPIQPATAPFPLLISGGASSVGQFAIQFAKLSGLQVFATASPKHFDLVKSLGADEVFDYHDPEVAKKIKAATGGKLKHAVDAISENGTPAIVAAALSDEGGVISVTLPYPETRAGVTAIPICAYNMLGKSYDFPFQWEATEEAKALGKRFAEHISKVISLNRLKPNPKVVYPSGLASVQQGLLDGPKISGQKIIFRIADTPDL